MGWEADAATAYDNQLRAAERHMSRGEDRPPMVCATCAHFHCFTTEDRWEMVSAVPEGTENRMTVCKAVCERMGVCDLRLDDVCGFVFADDYDGCDPDDGYEEAVS